jgi:CspA family cold shock protein
MYGDTTARRRTFEDVVSIILLFALLLAFKREAQCRHFAATLGRRCRLIWVQFQPWRLRCGSVLAFTAHVCSQLTARENLEDCMPTGKIKMFDEGRGFGFIKPDNGGVDVFFHVSALRDGDEITQGKAVSFEIGVDPKSGKTKAISVDLT